MKQVFDFDSIGKQTPYEVPDGFFESMQRKVLARAEAERRKAQKRNRMLWGIFSAAAFLAGLCFFLSFYSAEDTLPSSTHVLAAEGSTAIDPVDKWIIELSDEELEELVNFSENDIFFD